MCIILSRQHPDKLNSDPKWTLEMDDSVLTFPSSGDGIRVAEGITGHFLKWEYTSTNLREYLLAKAK